MRHNAHTLSEMAEALSAMASTLTEIAENSRDEWFDDARRELRELIREVEGETGGHAQNRPPFRISE
jgi:hypothetical protein